jgi:hypothetical protein
MAEDRIEKLAERFRTVVSRLDKAYQDCSHDLHPVVVNKSIFLETLIEHGLAHL